MSFSRRFRLSLLSILPLGSWAQSTAPQTFFVDASTVPGVSVSGRGGGQYPANIDMILGISRDEVTNAWLPFSITVSNNAPGGIVAVAVRWRVTDPSGNDSTYIMTRSLFEDDQIQIAPGTAVVAFPSALLSNHQNGIRNSLGGSGGSPSDLRNFRNASKIQVSLDGVVFASGIFVGPNTAHEYESLQADSAAGYDVASAVLEKRNSGVPLSDIVQWLQQTAAVRPKGASLLSRDWNTAATAREARMYLRIYRSRGESGLIAMAQQQMQRPHLPIHR